MNETFISRLFRTLSFLGGKSLLQRPLSLRSNERPISRKKPILYAVVILGFWAKAEAHTVVDISTAAPVDLEKKFIAATTTQFQAGLFVNPLAANTYAIKLFGYGEPVTVLGNSFDECIAHGFGDGMDRERFDIFQIMEQFRKADSSGTYKIAFDEIEGELCKRWSIIFTSTGGVACQ